MSGTQPDAERLQHDPQDAVPVASLTPRQQQILVHLRAGKSNKEIARALNIGLGTVKQHMAVLFKRLGVKNRAMAVSHVQIDDSESPPQARVQARRPCIVVSLGGIAKMPAEVRRHANTLMANYAYDYECFYLPDPAGHADFIFGLNRSSRSDLALALELTASLARDLAQTSPETLTNLQGAITAGYATVSQNRYGGWSGEAIDNPVISVGRRLLHADDAGHLRLDASVRQIARVFDLGLHGTIPQRVPFASLPEFGYWDAGFDAPLFGRDHELDILNSAVHARLSNRAPPGLILLEGENGMGKSRLCREVLRGCLSVGTLCHHFQHTRTGVWDRQGNRPVDLTAVSTRLQQTEPEETEVIIFEDMHHATEADSSPLGTLLENAHPRRVVLLTGRGLSTRASTRHMLAPLLHRPSTLVLHLNRLSNQATEQLLQHTRAATTAGNPSADDAGLPEEEWIGKQLNLCRGVPLFAVSLALATPQDLVPLPLVQVVCARLDAFRVDWHLLYCLAKTPRGQSIAALSAALGDSPEAVQASVNNGIKLGILQTAGKQGIVFKHPLIQHVVAYLADI